MQIKVALSVIATIIAVVSYVPYIRDIKRGKTKPHAFSWLIWSLLAYIAGFAQLKAGGGVGSSVALVTATISLWISFIAYKDGSVRITTGDWISLAAALAAIPIWLITKQPLLSVVIVSIIDVVGFWPTIRKSYNAPEQETLATHWLSTVKHCLTIAAQQRYNWTTVLYPASLAVTTGLSVIMLLVRKRNILH
jgi:hypothetical protein